MTKAELDNYLADDYIYTFNSNIARTKSDASRGGNLVKELKDFLAANPKKATQLQKKYGNIAWAYANESSEEGVALLSTLKSSATTQIDYLLLITKSENGIKIVARDRKDALKAKSLKELNGKTEKNQIPKEYLISAFLSFETIMFKYSDCDLIKELQKLGYANSERKGDRQCTYIPNYNITGYYSQGWTATYGYSDPNLISISVIITGYTFYCDGLNTFTENGWSDPIVKDPIYVPVTEAVKCNNKYQDFFIGKLVYRIWFDSEFTEMGFTNYNLAISSPNCKDGSYIPNLIPQRFMNVGRKVETQDLVGVETFRYAHPSKLVHDITYQYSGNDVVTFANEWTIGQFPWVYSKYFTIN